MYRGTTPVIVFRVISALNLSNMKQIWVTMQNAVNEITFNKNDLTVNAEENTITLELSQEDTLSFCSGVVKTQIRFLDENDRAYASNIRNLEMGNILKEGVISG